MTNWSACRGSWKSTASEVAVVPTTTSGSRSSITWAARPHHAATRHSLDLVQLRAFDRVPSTVDVRADAAATHETTLRAAVQMIESAAESEVGPSSRNPRKEARAAS